MTEQDNHKQLREDYKKYLQDRVDKSRSLWEGFYNKWQECKKRLGVENIYVVDLTDNIIFLSDEDYNKFVKAVESAEKTTQDEKCYSQFYCYRRRVLPIPNAEIIERKLRRDGQYEGFTDTRWNFSDEEWIDYWKTNGIKIPGLSK